MDTRQLKYFVAIVECGSMGKAAEKLYVAQPSLSQQMGRLESEFGTSLLLRSQRGVTPTAAGQALYARSRAILRQMEQLKQHVKEGASAESGTVAVGLPTTMVSVLAMPLIERVQQRYPGIHLQLIESMSGAITELLASARLDLAILFRASDTLGVTAWPLLEEQLFVMGEPGDGVAAEAQSCALSALNGVRMVAPGATNGLRLLLERVFARENLELNIVADIDSLPTLLSIAESGHACTILPVSALAQREAARCPKIRAIVAPELRRPASVCWSSTTMMSSATVAVCRMIVELVEDLTASGVWKGISLPDEQSRRTLAEALRAPERHA
ncbi:bacterial regulatory helix-turn-helix, lysR family protein [Paraburkholderia xenovorans LB400]|uniref:Transcriptional regulator, LysR family n=1 Tax=Paraburkholderia xenovorans (strain LB400) TaxID=266265 RepID=Q13H83_PARXL|nr:LysR substrate-binding domain-containing protein [Paraburkholderia xenovorans]ABE36556.1 transcriptional regulator, LysR family [Paraburkholderia xenovorans LB400]AIP34153.1 bacterial regulatory helix-turn-helix, lysR family protein [Paraburkholderia xenovorans LB400]